MKNIIVFTKYRFIGDTLVAIPTLRAARKTWPGARITMLSGAKACELLKNCPYIDNMVEFDPYRASNKGIPQYLKLVFALQKERFDLALVLNRSFHSALTAALGGVGRRSGWSGFQGRDFLLTDRCNYSYSRPEIDCCLDVLSAVTQHPYIAGRLELWVTEDERAIAAHLLGERRRDKLVGMQPGATHDDKRWPARMFGLLAEQLLDDDLERTLVLLGGSEEKAIAESVVHAVPLELRSRIVDLTGMLDLRGSLGVLTQLGCFIGNDTAVRHAAVALDTPSVGLFGPTSVEKWGNPEPPLHMVLRAADGSMDSITVAQVFVRALTALQSFEHLPSEVVR